jgi:4-hydroxybenzoate polyprenyltransferase
MKYLVQSRVWVALGASSVNGGVAFLLGVSPSFAMMVIHFLVCYAVYSLNMVSDLKEDALGNPARAAFARRFTLLIILVSLGSLILAVGMALPYGFHVVLGTFIPFLIGLSYSFGFIPTSLRPLKATRLKAIPLVKNLTIAGTWSLTAMVLQERSDVIVSVAALACVVLIALRVLMTSILPDMRDSLADRQHGINTIPVVYGEATTLRLVGCFNLLFAVVVLVCVWAGIFEKFALGLLFFSAYGAAYLWAIARRGVVTSLMCDVIVDGEHVIFGGVLLLAIHIFGNV